MTSSLSSEYSTPDHEALAAQAPARPWWREPYVWLVWSGPLAVVLACIVTGIVILRHPESIVDPDYYQHGLEINKTLREEASAAKLSKLPAMQARNHAAAAVLHDGGKP